MAPKPAGLLARPSGVRRATTVVAVGSTSTLVALVSDGMAHGDRAVPRMPSLGVAAAVECGIDLTRLAPRRGSGVWWPAILGGFLDRSNVVGVAMLDESRAAPARTLMARVPQRGWVLVSTWEWHQAAVGRSTLASRGAQSKAVTLAGSHGSRRWPQPVGSAAADEHRDAATIDRFAGRPTGPGFWTDGPSAARRSPAGGRSGRATPAASHAGLPIPISGAGCFAPGRLAGTPEGGRRGWGRVSVARGRAVGVKGVGR